MLSMLILTALLITYIFNIPFGYWRAHANRIKSRKEWVLSVHLPVPFIFLLRISISATLYMIPLFVLAFFSGQRTGSWIYNRFSNSLNIQTRCLFKDFGEYLSLSG